MKLLVQSDDYGISKAQALGCLEAIKFGIVKNTGIFVNLPWFEECAELIKPYINDICLGIDINLCAGYPLSDPSKISSLLQDNGRFLTSGMNRALDNESNNFDHVNCEEMFIEAEAHLQKYLKYFGKLPDYIQSHAYDTKKTSKVLDELGKKYGVPFTQTICEKYGMVESAYWYTQPITYETQKNSSLKDYILQDKENLLSKEYACIVCHTGYVDKELLDLSTYTIYRVKDLEAMTSNEVKNWIKDNNVELITYKNL